ncbi:hypothetical protein [uncultured Tistrella sp.]|uniref:hypothetical protein n=1 Tax=Tistrella mobilis TaxID=171437 RepID=UPI00262CF248|nr:hypothetical protein [uncultured Tistrella sp.]
MRASDRMTWLRRHPLTAVAALAAAIWALLIAASFLVPVLPADSALYRTLDNRAYTARALYWICTDTSPGDQLIVIGPSSARAFVPADRAALDPGPRHHLMHMAGAPIDEMATIADTLVNCLPPDRAARTRLVIATHYLSYLPPIPLLASIPTLGRYLENTGAFEIGPDGPHVAARLTAPVTGPVLRLIERPVFAAGTVGVAAWRRIHARRYPTADPSPEVRENARRGMIDSVARNAGGRAADAPDGLARLDALIRAVHRLQAAGIRVTVYQSVESRALRKAVPQLAAFRRLEARALDEAGIPHLDFGDEIADDEFVDGIHALQTAQPHWSRLLLQRLGDL